MSIAMREETHVRIIQCETQSAMFYQSNTVKHRVPTDGLARLETSGNCPAFFNDLVYISLSGTQSKRKAQRILRSPMLTAQSRDNMRFFFCSLSAGALG